MVRKSYNFALAFVRNVDSLFFIKVSKTRKNYDGFSNDGSFGNGLRHNGARHRNTEAYQCSLKSAE